MHKTIWGEKEALNLQSLLKASHDDFDILEKQRKKGLHSPLKFNFSKKKKSAFFHKQKIRFSKSYYCYHFLKKMALLAAVLHLFLCLCAEFFFFSILITQTLQISHVKDRATFASKLFIPSANHTLRHVEKKRATFSSIENRSAKPTCQTVNAFEISSLSSKEVRFYLVKKELRHMTTEALLHFGRYSNLESCFY